MAKITVRYVKLGRGGKWERECIRDGTLRLGFWTGSVDMFEACSNGERQRMMDLLRQRRGKPVGASVTDDLRQVRSVFEDDGSTVWITFYERRMYWGRLDPLRPAERVGDEAGSRHFLIAPGWRCTTDTPRAEVLLKDDLAGHLGKVTQYRGTICAPARPEYVLRRIGGEDSKVAQDAAAALSDLEEHVLAMTRALTPKDFEVLVDMTLQASGWRRIGIVGGTQEDVDLVLERSAIGGRAAISGADVERVGVQVKSHATTSVLERCADRMRGTYDRALFVHHSGQVDGTAVPDVSVIDGRRLAAMVVDAGLTRWLLRRVR